MGSSQPKFATAWSLALVLALLLWITNAGAEFAGGTGEPNDPYGIATAEQLVSIGVDPNLMDNHFVLLNDIDLDPNLPGRRVFDRAVIGEEEHIDTEFRGGFSGGGHVIRNLVIVSEQHRPVGLFAALSGATVEQLGLENASVSGVQMVGVLAGENAGTITACYATGVVMCHTRAKYRPRRSLEESESPADEDSARMLAGLRAIYGDPYLIQLGQANQPETPARAGGLVAVNYGAVESCYAAVTVETTGENPDMLDLGGLVGVNGGRIYASYAVGPVAKNNGGLIGNNAVTPYLGGYPIPGYVFLSFWDSQASGNAASAAGAGRTTAQMMDVETFQGWDYGGHWTIDSGSDYPHLRWEARTGSTMPSFDAYVEGTGDANDPFVIETADELTKVGRFRSTWDRHLALGSDIDMGPLDPNDYAPIGTLYLPFTGIFDGCGHTIRNFTYHDKTSQRVGLFGQVGYQDVYEAPNQGLIQNVSISQGSVSGRSRIGLLVGESWGSVRSCSVGGIVTGTGWYVGGLAGFSAGRIEDCSSSGNIRGADSVGGLIGASRGKSDIIESCSSFCSVTGQTSVGGLAGRADGSVRNSWATGSVDGIREVGGLIGDATSHVRACYATGNVSGEEEVGGLVGDSLVSIVTCYASGTVTGIHRTGGLVGYNSGGVVASYSTGQVTGEEGVGGLIGSQTYAEVRRGSDLLCFWDDQTSGTSVSDGGTGRTTAQLMQAATFEGWGLQDTWVLDEGRDYPRLAWEGLPGAPLRDDPQRYGGGTGAPDDPFQIQTTDHLCAIGYYPGDFDHHFVLAQDIDYAGLGPTAFRSIGVEGFPFVGEFDGQGYAISNLTITRPHENYVGLFDHAAPMGLRIKSSSTRIVNLHLRDIRVQGREQVGGLVAVLGIGTVTDCTVTGQITGQETIGGLIGLSFGEAANCLVDVEIQAGHDAGALVGYNTGTVTSCGAAGTVTGETRLGGLVGLNRNIDPESFDWNASPGRSGLVSQSRADCVVTGIREIGGLIGSTSQYSRIESCYTQGAVTGEVVVGGLVGSFDRASITNSYAAMIVSGEETVGGFIGRQFDGEHGTSQWYIPEIVSCYWDTTLSATTAGTGISPKPQGVVGLSTEQMQGATIFLDAGWDFENVWAIREGEGYPRLRWETE